MGRFFFISRMEKSRASTHLWNVKWIQHSANCVCAIQKLYVKKSDDSSLPIFFFRKNAPRFYAKTLIMMIGEYPRVAKRRTFRFVRNFLLSTFPPRRRRRRFTVPCDIAQRTREKKEPFVVAGITTGNFAICTLRT